MFRKTKLNLLIGSIAVGTSGLALAQFVTTPLAEPTFSASPISSVPKVGTFGVPIGSGTQERLNEPIAIQRVRCGQDDACFRGNEPDSELSQDDLVESRAVDPVTVDDGLYASLSLGYTHHDNVERTATDEKEDDGLGVGLGLVFRNRVDRLSYQLGAHTSAVGFDDNDNNDFDSYSLSAGLLYELTEIIDLGLHAGYSESNENRNASGSRIVDSSKKSDDVETQIIGGQITIGRPQSRLQVVVAASHSDVDFTLNDIEDIANGAIDLRDRELDHLSGAVFYNTQGPIRYFLEANITDIDYDNDSIRRLDSEETGVYVGALWSLSQITSAEFKIGQLDKDFDNADLDDYDETSYSAKLRWQPTHRTAFTFYGTRRAEETTEIESSFFESKALGVNVAYQVLPTKLDLIGYYNKIDDEFSSGRDDETKDYGIGFVYHPRRWLGVGFRYGKSERESNRADANYDDDYYDIFLQLNAGKSIKLF